MNQPTYRNVITDKEVDEMIARDAIRRQEAIERLGHRWLLAGTRLAQPENVTTIKTKKVRK